MNKAEKLIRLVENGLDRRAFVKGLSLASVGLAGATLIGCGGGAATALGQTGDGSSTGSSDPPPIADNDVLNFALNLEYLEAEFYTVATTGKTIEDIGLIPSSAVSGPTTGGRQVTFDSEDTDADNDGGVPVGTIANAITFDEQQHVVFLRAVLGSAAIPKPAINLDALHLGFATINQFLTLARAFEDVGVSAYGGAAPLIQDKKILAAAARIALTEALHAGDIRFQVLQRAIPVPPVDSMDVVPSLKKPFTVDNQALAIVRTPQQVLKIVYAGGTTSGGFFPDGVNGTIRSSASS